MKILITGGTGLIGRAICKELAILGHEITVLSRNPNSVAEKCGKNIKAIKSLDEYTPDVIFDAIINLAGEPIVDKPWTDSRKNSLWDSRITLTEKIVDKIGQAYTKPNVLLSGSAIGFYPNLDTKIINESTQPSNDLHFGVKICIEWEKSALKANNLGVRVCNLRTGLVMAKDGGVLQKMLLPFKLGLGSSIGNGMQYMSWIHIDDYVKIIKLLLENQNAVGAYNMVAPNPVTNKEFTKTLAQVLKRPAIFFTPTFLIKLLLGQRAYLLLDSQRIVPHKLQELGYKFEYPNLFDALDNLV
ncbi:MAG: hypothetical protein RLZZ210_153 [Pseudomonadota bacterium]|jgi:uncharacterized protein (TIGR01777 family)